MTDILDEFIASIVDYSETLVNIFQTTPWNTPEDSHLNKE
jgi:hypothetical protein